MSKPGKPNPSGKLPGLVRGKPLRDSNKPVILNITPNDVKLANSKDPTSCAAARAIKRQLGVKECAVMRSATYINYGDEESPDWARYKTTASLAREIVAIDRGGRFEPGNYLIRPHSPTSALGTHPYIRRTPKTGKKMPKFRHFTTNIREI